MVLLMNITALCACFPDYAKFASLSRTKELTLVYYIAYYQQYIISIAFCIRFCIFSAT